jgi:hypothetical protein
MTDRDVVVGPERVPDAMDDETIHEHVESG